MHKKRALFGALSVILAVAVLLSACDAVQRRDVSEYKERGSVRLGCIISEEYQFFTEQLYYMASSLQTARMMGALPYSPESEKNDAESLWEGICSVDVEDDLCFEKDCFYDFSAMDDGEKDALLRSSEVDLLLVFGTSAGAWLTQNADRLTYDYMVFASADPVTAGIVKSETERYNDRSFAHIDPGRIKRQIELTYEVYPFQSIGVVYEDSEAAYSYSGIRYLEELSAEHGFSVHTVHVDEPKSADDKDRYYQELKEAYHSLLGKIGVLYITTGMIEDEKLPWLLSEVHEAGIVTVAETSESQVEYGAMLHITMSDAREEGQFAAGTLREYMRGVPIDELEQIFLITPHISLNETTVEETGAVIPMSVYLIADHVYRGVKDAE